VLCLATNRAGTTRLKTTIFDLWSYGTIWMNAVEACLKVLNQAEVQLRTGCQPERQASRHRLPSYSSFTKVQKTWHNFRAAGFVKNTNLRIISTTVDPIHSVPVAKLILFISGSSSISFIQNKRDLRLCYLRAFFKHCLILELYTVNFFKIQI
jgi:hypothetical protein